MTKHRYLIFGGILVLLIIACRTTKVHSKLKNRASHIFDRGAIVRADHDKKSLSLVFTGDEFAEGGEKILNVLAKHSIKASFFFTGRFYRNVRFKTLIEKLRDKGHYLGAHSDQHLLYCAWNNRDSLLITRAEFEKDLLNNYLEMERLGINKSMAPYFLPPYEWYNDSISMWTNGLGFTLINYTPGTRSHADYTTPEMDAYLSSEAILQSIMDYEKDKLNGLNGFLLLSHIGAGPLRQDKFYLQLDTLINWLKQKGYHIERIDKLLN